MTLRAFTPAGRARAEAALFDAVRADVEIVFCRIREAADARRLQVYRDVFGPGRSASPMDQIGHRDARVRVAAADMSDRLLDLMTEAELFGDRQLLAAAVARAYDRSVDGGEPWRSLVDRFSPRVRDGQWAVAELDSISEMLDRLDATALILAPSEVREVEVN